MPPLVGASRRSFSFFFKTRSTWPHLCAFSLFRCSSYFIALVFHCCSSYFTALMFHCCSSYFAAFVFHSCSSCFVALVWCFIVPLCVVTLLLIKIPFYPCCFVPLALMFSCFTIVFPTSLLLLLHYSSLVHCCCMVFRHSSMLCYFIAHPNTFLPLIVLLFLHASLLLNASLFPCLNWYFSCSFFFLICVRNLELFGRKLKNIQVNSKFLLFFTCFFEIQFLVFLPSFV